MTLWKDNSSRGTKNNVKFLILFQTMQFETQYKLKPKAEISHAWDARKCKGR